MTVTTTQPATTPGPVIPAPSPLVDPVTPPTVADLALGLNAVHAAAVTGDHEGYLRALDQLHASVATCQHVGGDLSCLWAAGDRPIPLIPARPASLTAPAAAEPASAPTFLQAFQVAEYLAQILTAPGMHLGIDITNWELTPKINLDIRSRELRDVDDWPYWLAAVEKLGLVGEVTASYNTVVSTLYTIIETKLRGVDLRTQSGFKDPATVATVRAWLAERNIDVREYEYPRSS